MKVKALVDELQRLTQMGAAAPELKDALTKIVESLRKRDSWEIPELLFALDKFRRPRAEDVANAAQRLTAADYSRKLAASFFDDTAFETAITALGKDKTISRDEIIAIYNKLFDAERVFKAKDSKPKIVGQIRSERLVQVRFAGNERSDA